MSTVSERYWHRTLHDMDTALGQEPLIAPVLAPPPVKLYPEATRQVLPDHWPLSTLLRYTYGYARVDVTASGLSLHRVVPSARCQYPAEVYVWVPPGDRAPAGLHYYDPAHHSLVLLRPGDDGSALASAVAIDLSGAAYALIVTVLFWKVAYRYGDYAYRLCTQEAGVVAGNALAAVAAMGLRGHVHHQFLDEPLRRWLDLTDGEESPMMALPLYPARHRDPIPLAASRATAVPRWRPSSPLDRQVCAPFLELDAASRYTATAEIARPPEQGDRLPRGRPVPAPVLTAAPPADLVSALRARTSGPYYFNASGEPAPAEALYRVCQEARRPHISDATAPGELAVELMVAVNRVAGVPPGSYAVRSGGALEQLRPGPVASALARAARHQFTVNFETACFVVSVVGDPGAMGRWLGERGYRVLNAEAGIVAQRVCLASAADGLAARPYNSYDAAAIAELLGLRDTGLVPIFQIAVGRPRVTGTMSFRMAV